MPGWRPSRRRSSGSRTCARTTPTTCRSSTSCGPSWSTRRATSCSTPGATPDEAEQEPLDHRAIRAALLVAQREAVIRLRDDGVINDETLRLIERDLDLEALRAGA